MKVQYIDFGNCEETNPKAMVERPADMTFVKPYAQKIMMHNTRYIGPKEKEVKATQRKQKWRDQSHNGVLGAVPRP